MAHQDSLKLKRLQSQRYTLENDLQLTESHINSLQHKLTNIQQRLQRILLDIARIEGHADAFVVTEHALLRYVERILGYDMDVLSAAILPQEARSQISKLGNGVYPVTTAGHSFRIRVQGSVVTTVLPPTGE